MDREAALAYLKAQGFDTFMANASRQVDDSPDGYGPSLDRAWAAYGHVHGSSPAEIPADAVFGFQYLLEAVTYDLLLPTFVTEVDVSIDAPLTSGKFSQSFRAVQYLRDSAWRTAEAMGYVMVPSMSGSVAVLDFREPGPNAGGDEYA